jgi:hypothetical protein
MALRLNWDADGDDSANPGGEWLQVRNLDPVNPVALGGWYVRDSSLRRYTFPSSAVAPPGGRVTVNVGTTGDGGSVFAWGLRAPLFDKASGDHQALGDGAYLFDPLGNVRASLIYPCRVNCADPRAGAVRLRATPTGAEGFALTNVSAGAVSLDGTQLRTRRAGYHFGPDAVLAPGQTLLLAVRGDPAQDTALDRHWGLTRTILDDADDLVRLTTDTDVTLACAAWGDRGC